MPPSHHFRAPPLRTSCFAAATALVFVALIAWDRAGGDMALARWMGGASGFPLRDDFWMRTVLHDGAKRLAWGFVLVVCATAAWPRGPFAALPPSRRLQLAAGPLLATGVVTLLKGASLTSCPWDMVDFGGSAQHLSHWLGWWTADGGTGHCFPAGHASVGFAFCVGYFALRHHHPRLARWWLATAFATGLLLGVVQQLRGAHFLSHTLWTGWLCWTVGWLTDPLFDRNTAKALQGRPA